MMRGRVIGKIWSSRRVEAMPSGALLTVELAGGGHLIALIRSAATPVRRV